MKVARRLSALLIGLVFFIAGLLKLMDPVGSGLIVEEYFKFFGLRFLVFSSKAVGYTAALLETITGAALVTGVWRRISAIVSGAMLAFFTLITLILLIFNPSMDCGCFGEALHLTHFQSFAKNIILCGLWALAFVPFGKIGEERKRKRINFAVAALSAFIFSLHALSSIPPVDFTPYAPGAELGQSDGTMLSFSDADGNYLDEEAGTGDVVIVSAYNPSRLREKTWSDIAALFSDASSKGTRPMLLAASTPSDIGSIVKDSTVLASTYFADRRELLTLNRSNGGATLVSDGLVITKWPARSLDKAEMLPGETAADATMLMMSKKAARNLKTEGFILGLMAIILL